MTDAGDIARTDLRSYALRRCIRFYTGILVLTLFMVATTMERHDDRVGNLLDMSSLVFAILAAVEVASGLVMLRIAKVRDRFPGPEAGLWRVAQGPHPSWVAAAFFVFWALLPLVRHLP